MSSPPPRVKENNPYSFAGRISTTRGQKNVSHDSFLKDTTMKKSRAPYTSNEITAALPREEQRKIATRARTLIAKELSARKRAGRIKVAPFRGKPASEVA